MNEMSAKSQHHAEFSMGGSTHFLVKFDILDNFEGKSKVAKQNVYA
jgi:stress-induced morphogen